MREATYLRLLILSLKAGKDFVKSEESKIDKFLSKLVYFRMIPVIFIQIVITV